MKRFCIEKVYCLLFFLLLGLLAAAQELSNKGKDFWVTFPAHVDGNSAVMGLYITSDVAATGQVKVGTATIPFSIAANAVKHIFIGPNVSGDALNTAVYLSTQDGVVPGAAIHITANEPVVAYAHIIKDFSSGASLLLPSNVWGKDYIVPNYASQGVSGSVTTDRGFGILNVVAKEANTVVEINPTAAGRNGARPAGTTYTITLNNPGDVYQIQYERNTDISGTTVKSIATAGGACKPIAVFSASTWSGFDCVGASSGDNLFQQIFPVRAFGKTFLTAPFKNRNYDIVRVFITDPATVVTRTENGVTTTLTFNARGFAEFKTDKPNKIDASKPISVVQYITSQSCFSNSVHSDPEMVVLNPVEQTINNITVFSAHKNYVPIGQSGVDECYLNIIIKTNAAPSFKINGAAPTGSFVAITGTAYSYLQENVTAKTLVSPVQTLTADSNFAAIAYGYGDRESYGYNAGTNVKDLYQYIVIRNNRTSVGVPATCAKTPVKFSVVLPYQPTSLQWQFNGKFTDVTVTTPVADSTFVLDGITLRRYTLPTAYESDVVGTFPVSVVASNPNSDGCGGEQKIDFELEVLEAPRARFGWQHSGCLADAVVFKDSSNMQGRPVMAYAWDFGDNTKATTKDFTKTYTAAGTYTVKQTITNDIGCLADTTASINISPVPVASFTVAGPFCSGTSLTFTDASTISSGTIGKRYWDFGNGRKDTLTTGVPANLRYTAAGEYTISLVVEAPGGCRSQAFTQKVTITVGAIPGFEKPAAACLPFAEVTFTNKTTIADGTQNQLTYLWNFGDGSTSIETNPLYVYNKAGSYLVKLHVTSANGCTSEFTDIFDAIYEKPKAGITATGGICLGDTVQLKDNSTATGGQQLVRFGWNFGGNAMSVSKDTAFKFPAAGTYTIRHWAVSDKGCVSDTVTQSHLVNPLPTASFTSGQICDLQPTTFTSTSVANVGNLVRWWWDFNDGTQLARTDGNSFQHQLPGVIDRVVKLVVTNSLGCRSDTASRVLQIKPSPLVNFGMPVLCDGSPAGLFTDSTTISNNTESNFTWLWDFGDANSSGTNTNTATTKDATHRFSIAGDYAVKLQVTSDNGCVGEAVKTLRVHNGQPAASFNLVSGAMCSGNEIKIRDNSTANNIGAITRTEIFWNWPSTTEKTVDDNPAWNKEYSHRYAAFSTPAQQTFHVRYVVYIGTGCSNEVNKNITLDAGPMLVFQQIPGICADAQPRLITQAAETSGQGGSGAYGGTGISAGGLFSPATAGIGTHNVFYYYNSPNGCKDTARQTITVWPLPVAAFTANSVCVGAPATFQDASTPGFGKINQWNWTFDGTPQTFTNGNNFQKTFTGSSVAVSLKVATDSGCQSAVTNRTLAINPLPVADFDLPTALVCLPSGMATFTNKSTIADGSASQLTYLWDFGVAGSSSTQKDGSYRYAAVNNYTVRLQTTSKDGCVASTSKVFGNIAPQPMANIELSPAAICLGGAVSFTDRSNPLSETIASWHWNFKDGNISGQQNPVYTYGSAGTYEVAMYYTTARGCNSDTVSRQVIIHANPIVNAGPDIAVLQGGQRTIQATVTGSSNYQYQWSPGTALSSTSILRPITTTQQDITYTLTVTGEGGCIGSDAVFVKYALAPEVPNAFSPNGDGINDTWNIKYIDSYPGATISVFDRYGRQVFNSIGYSRRWDGRSGGNYLPTGVYYYIIDPKNGKDVMKGSLTLLR